MRSCSKFMTAVTLFAALILFPFFGKSNSAAAASDVAPAAVLQTVFGAEMGLLTPAQGINQMAAANTTWTRRNAVVWSAVEPTEGARNWSALSALEAELQDASAKGMQVILIVRSTPEWARKIPGTGSTCGPVHVDKLPALASFMHDLAARYSAAPYNVKYWELWNEPDVDPSLVPTDSVFGCWGDQNDAYYGGGHYADMLKAVYPQVKSADAQSQVLLGGLLMDCDPRPAAGCAAIFHSTLPGKFLEGVLLNNGGPYFDGISFHAYDFYNNQLGQYSNNGWQSAWNTTGPVLIAKAQFIRSVLSQYNVGGKFLMNTETALLCDTCSNDSTFEAAKAYYLAQANAAAIAQGLQANIWFSVLGWRNSGLLNTDLTPRPAYTAFQFGRSELQNASWMRDITEYAGVKGYEVQRGNRRIWFLWSLDGGTHTVNLPAAPSAAWDSLGSAVTPSAAMDASLNPLYLEWNISFTDVPVGFWAGSWIERLYSAGITSGCATTPSLIYCPNDFVTRAQMAIFLEKGVHGSGFVAPVVPITFDDTNGHWAQYWIEALRADGITSGCVPGVSYCPDASTTRAQMAVFLLRAKHGAAYIPPDVLGDTGFTDVPVGYWADKWIKQLAVEGITGGCGPGLYCPEDQVTRAQMAVFLVRTFSLP